MTFDEIARKIEQALAEHNLPSVAVAVAKDGEILWEQGFGWADRERRIPATPPPSAFPHRGHQYCRPDQL